ncbi:MAG: hypothetical protein NWQ09_11985 [Nonlabens sp.]|nr:hypothetical protein [Nonlabens sp.]
MTVLWIILAAIVAALVALFQYGYIFGSTSKTKKPWFALLRFLTVFCVLVLLIGPKFNKKTYETLKPQLLLMVDDSKSLTYLNVASQQQQDVDAILNDRELTNKFDIKTFAFSEQVLPYDKATHKGLETDLGKAISEPQELYKDRNKAIIILTDGNQTSGSNYTFAKVDSKTTILPLIYGDTTQYPDLRISQLNVNRYTYLNNEFPVEIFVNYQGDATVNQDFTIKQGNSTLYQQRLTFSPTQRTATINANLKSTSIGTMSLRATISSLNAEKNVSNNTRNFAVEVIDQQTKILILSDVVHPDIAALKNAIESNQQRKVELAKTSDGKDLNDYNLVIMVGVNSAFAKAYTQLSQLGKNTWVITGTTTDFNFLNSQTKGFQIENDPEYDDAQPLINGSYATFNVDEFKFNDYPPVQVPFGKVKANTPLEVLMFKQIGNVETNQPLWFTYEQGEQRHAVTLASGLWRWRTQSYQDSQNFENFDNLVNSQVQYLSSNKKRDRLELDYEPFYYSNKKIVVKAQYLDKNYEFEDNGILNISLKNKTTGASLKRPLVLNGTTYTVDLSDIAAGDYSFTVKVDNDNLSRGGSFSVLEFDIENQFVSANAQSMQQLVGPENVLYAGQLDALKKKLMNSDLLQSVERETVRYSSIIDWEILLGIILLLLGIEWFARKYNGLI